MPWQVSMLFFFVFSVGLALQRRAYSQKSKLPGRSAPALSYVLAVLPLGIIVGTFGGDFEVVWSTNLVVSLLLMAIGVGLFNWLVFEASKKLSVALFQTLFQLNSVTAVVLGWLLLDEGLSLQQFIGSILLLTGAVLAAQSYKTDKKQKFVGSAIFIGIIASVSLGAAIVAEKQVLESMSIHAYYIIGFAAQTLVICAIAANDLRSLNYASVAKSDWLNTLLMGSLSALVGFFFIYSLNAADNVSLVTVVSTFQLPLAALAGYVFLKEKEVGWKLALGLAISFTGLLLAAL